MINSVGTIANGVFSELISQVVQRVFTKRRRRNIIIESLNMHMMGAAAIDNVLEIYPKVIGETRIGAMVDCEIYHVNNIVAKVLVNVQLT